MRIMPPLFFETLNDRGIDLSTPDLLRNLLIRRAQRSRFGNPGGLQSCSTSRVAGDMPPYIPQANPLLSPPLGSVQNGRTPSILRENGKVEGL
jgi:hypothetical protein